MSHMSAPHLPPASSSLRWRTETQRIKWVVLTVCLSLFAGAVGSLYVLGRLYPQDSRPLYVVNNHNNTNAPVLDANMVRDWRYRRVWLYESSQVTGGVYTEAARVAPAVVLNSGGWIVWYSAGQAVPVVALDWQGTKYQIEKTIRTNSGLVFAKLTGGNFRATTAFVDWPRWTESAQLWAWGTEWRALSWEKDLLAPTVSLATEPAVNYRLVGSEPGATVTDMNGALVGLAGKNGQIIPGWYIAAVLPQIMTGAQLPPEPVDWQGSFVTGLLVGPQWQESTGFYVTAARTKRGVEAVQKGDVITALNQQPVSPESLARLLATLPNQFTATVWREGVLRTITVDKITN